MEKQQHMEVARDGRPFPEQLGLALRSQERKHPGKRDVVVLVHAEQRSSILSETLKCKSMVKGGKGVKGRRDKGGKRRKVMT